MNRRAFSLVELMIVVAIIGILAAIAIPSFVEMQLKSKRAEVPGCVDGIKTAEIAYEASFNEFVDLSPSPAGNPGKALVDWAPSESDWDAIGWRPDGKVRGFYQVLDITATDFTVEGRSDADGDGNEARYTASTSINSTLDPADLNKY